MPNNYLQKTFDFKNFQKYFFLLKFASDLKMRYFAFPHKINCLLVYLIRTYPHCEIKLSVQGVEVTILGSKIKIESKLNKNRFGNNHFYLFEKSKFYLILTALAIFEHSLYSLARSYILSGI